MKFLILCVGLAFVLINGAPTELEYDQHLEGIFEDIVNNTIKSITDKLTDPIVIKYLALNFTTPGFLEGSGTLSDAKLFGMKYLVATYIHLKGLSSFNATVVIPDITLSFKYLLNAVLLDLVPLYGEGLNSINIEHTKLNVSGKINFSSGLQIKNITVLINLGNTVFNLNGLLNNPEFSALVNTALNDNFVFFVNNNSALLSGILGPIVEQIINGGGRNKTSTVLKETWDISADAVVNDLYNK